MGSSSSAPVSHGGKTMCVRAGTRHSDWMWPAVQDELTMTTSAKEPIHPYSRAKAR